jgi:hypothetical protein
MTTISYQQEYKLFSMIQSKYEPCFLEKYDKWNNTATSPRKRNYKSIFVELDKDKLRFKAAVRTSRKLSSIMESEENTLAVRISRKLSSIMESEENTLNED